MQKFDIHVTFSVTAKTEQKADEEVINFLKLAEKSVGSVNIVDWELTEFLPNEELTSSCCC